MARDLHERGICGDLVFRLRIRPAGVPDRAVIGDICAAIGAEPDIRRPVEPGGSVDEGLLGGIQADFQIGAAVAA